MSGDGGSKQLHDCVITQPYPPVVLLVRLSLIGALSVSLQEKAMGNRPSEMMDREKAYIPELQISFMEHIAMPIYNTPLLPHHQPTHVKWGWQVNNRDGIPPHIAYCPLLLKTKSAELYERVAANREQWTKVSHKFTIRGLPSNNSLDFLDEEYELMQEQSRQSEEAQRRNEEAHRINGCMDLDTRHNQ
ncbi:hypothetical protein JZ751_028548 [Albula glossodonta]|uniref:PDEase domain-containing protein n=1 Tax=Albula glossodonta TaxID=121402 RepID=A0A8T2NF33_9TELE|nr:hypothetical protein JZ751_013861 [Albula glossodonta]KAG9337531.1 hypothetical protein JZ751_028548 [Albula glossodonta]